MQDWTRQARKVSLLSLVVVLVAVSVLACTSVGDQDLEQRIERLEILNDIDSSRTPVPDPIHLELYGSVIGEVPLGMNAMSKLTLVVSGINLESDSLTKDKIKVRYTDVSEGVVEVDTYHDFTINPTIKKGSPMYELEVNGLDIGPGTIFNLVVEPIRSPALFIQRKAPMGLSPGEFAMD